MSYTPKLDLSKYDLLFAKDVLFCYVCEKAKSWGYDPNVECVLLSPKQSKDIGLKPVWRFMWESGSYDWGVYLSLGGVTFVQHDGDWNMAKPEIILGQPESWYLETYYGFDVGFVPHTPYADFDCDQSNTINFTKDASSLIERHRWHLEGKIYNDIIGWINNYNRIKGIEL